MKIATAQHERKDAHDIVYGLEHYKGGVDAVLEQFVMALETEHAPIKRKALGLLAYKFCYSKSPDESYLKDGPVAVAKFDDDEADVQKDANLATQQLVR